MSGMSWEKKSFLRSWELFEVTPTSLGKLTIRIPKDMGMVWVPLTIRGTHVLGGPWNFPWLSPFLFWDDVEDILVSHDCHWLLGKKHFHNYRSIVIKAPSIKSFMLQSKKKEPPSICKFASASRKSTLVPQPPLLGTPHTISKVRPSTAMRRIALESANRPFAFQKKKTTLLKFNIADIAPEKPPSQKLPSLNLYSPR